jgi:hypothetical protein
MTKQHRELGEMFPCEASDDGRFSREELARIRANAAVQHENGQWLVRRALLKKRLRIVR